MKLRPAPVGSGTEKLPELRLRSRRVGRAIDAAKANRRTSQVLNKALDHCA